jgi:GntR family transcriptional regulator/MocR family aminotransferase
MEKLIARNTSHIAGRKRHSHSSAQAKPDAENILDFSPFANATEDLCDYDNNYLLDKYKKTLKRQGIKRQKFVSNICGLLSLRQAISAQLRSNSDIDCSAENVVVFADMRSCLDFVARLLGGDVSHAILERPGNREVKSIAIYNSFHCNEIAIDEQGLIVEHLSNMDVRRALAIITPTIQDPLGVSMSLGRKEQILDWAQQTGSLIVDRTAHQSFVKNFDSTSLWQLSGGKSVIGIWEFASILKPWSQMCCAFFPEEFVVLARQLKAVIGGEVPLNEQFAMHEFIVDGDLAKTQRHRELLYLEKRRILNLACSKVFDNRIRAMSINKGSKLVFDVSSEIDLNSVIECARRVEIPASCLTVPCADELSSKMLIDLDCISLERIPEKIEALQCVLEVYRSRGCMV